METNSSKYEKGAKSQLRPLEIKGAVKTPSIVYSPDENYFEISGKSIPEDHNTFFKPVLDWLDDFTANPPDKTQFDINLEYFNTSSSKILLRIFKTLEKVQLRNKQIEVKWHFEEDDLDMKECGQDFSAMVNIPFTFIEEEE